MFESKGCSYTIDNESTLQMHTCSFLMACQEAA